MKLPSVSHWIGQRPGRLLLVPVGFLVIFFVVPLVLILLTSLQTETGLSLAGYREAFSSPAFLIIIWRTVRVSAIVTALALLLGYPYAYVLVKLSRTWRSVFTFVAIAPFFTSILIRSYAWVAILNTHGLLNNMLLRLNLISQPIQLVYNETGVLVGMTQIELPLMILTLYAPMSRIDPALTQAAESLGAHPITAFARVFLPLSRPGIVSGCGLVFTSALGFYVTPTLLGGPGEFVVTESIYEQVSTVADLTGAAVQASVLLLIVLTLLILFRQSLARATVQRETPSLAVRDAGRIASVADYFPQALLTGLGPAARLLSVIGGVLIVAMFAFTAVALVAPLVVVFPLAFSALPYLSFPPEGFSLAWVEGYLGSPDWVWSTWFSAWIGTCAALVSTLIGSVAAYAMSRRASGRGFYEVLFISPMILPQFVVALAMYYIIAKLGIVGNPLTFIVAYAVFGFPFVFLIMFAAFQRFDHTLAQAASILGAPPISTWRRVVIPILAPAFMSAFFFSFLVAFDDLVVGLFFSTAESYTLPMRMWDDIRLEISPRIAAVAVVLFTAAVGIALAVATARRIARAVMASKHTGVSL